MAGPGRSGLPRVYPRVGGETDGTWNDIPVEEGLSPRGRGNPASAPPVPRVLGSIPAWAGKPRAALAAVVGEGVYPRVGGETVPPPPRARWYRVYPRVGGETMAGPLSAGDEEGLSPRGRGNRVLKPLCARQAGSIPAWAGKPGGGPGVMVNVGVYPRVGGETDGGSRHRYQQTGLSPRGRGNRLGVQGPTATGGSIPAWAGKPTGGYWGKSRMKVYPRVGGETASFVGGAAWEKGLSPRGRGNRRRR